MSTATLPHLLRPITGPAAANEVGAGYDAAMINWRFMANAVWDTKETVRRMIEAAKPTVTA